MSFTPGAGTRFLLFSTTNPSSAGTTLPGPLSITGGTATANTPVLSATQTWNNAAVTFTGWQLNVTDTASNAASLLMDLQVGGSSFFSVTKVGSARTRELVINPGNNNIPLAITNQTASTPGGLRVITIYPFSGGILFQDGSSANLSTLVLDAAQTLAQRNGVNWQAFRIYSTYTDASNYERLEIRQSGTGWFIGSNSLGTGPGNRALAIMSNGQLNFGSNGGDKWLINTTGHFLANTDNSFDIGAVGANRPRNVFWAGYQEMSEMTAPAAPATNSVRIYAEDNGSGKTRLMARFATGAAQQIAIEP